MTTKQKQAHTPGEWHACKDGKCGCGGIMTDDIFIAKVYGPWHQSDGIAGPDVVPDKDHQRANARLIAASPAMLAAINALYDWLLRAMTEDNLDERDSATCPICHLPEPGNFDSIHEDDHHDGCPWPQFLRARSLAQDV